MVATFLQHQKSPAYASAAVGLKPGLLTLAPPAAAPDDAPGGLSARLQPGIWLTTEMIAAAIWLDSWLPPSVPNATWHDDLAVSVPAGSSGV